VERRIALVTGSNGFIGRTVCPALEREGWEVRRAVRSVNPNDSRPAGVVETGDIAGSTHWPTVLAGVDSVVHLAARVHVPGDDNEQAFRLENTEATLRLADAAVRAGVRRFLYVSTVKVMGEASPDGHAFTESNPPHPADAYARSKLESEKGLRGFAGKMEIAILRPPLVYGPAVGANFLRLLRWVDRGVWLPFGAVANRRSLLYVGNLASAIAACLTHPAATKATFFVSDGEDVSTPELIRRVAASLGRRDRCWSAPPGALRAVATVAGFGEPARRMLDSLVVDSRLIRTNLSWHPPFALDDGLRATAEWFRMTDRRT